MTNEQEDMLKLFSDFCKQPAGDSGLEIGEYLDEEFMFSLFCEIYRFLIQAIRDQEAEAFIRERQADALEEDINERKLREHLIDGICKILHFNFDGMCPGRPDVICLDIGHGGTNFMTQEELIAELRNAKKEV